MHNLIDHHPFAFECPYPILNSEYASFIKLKISEIHPQILITPQTNIADEIQFIQQQRCELFKNKDNSSVQNLESETEIMIQLRKLLLILSPYIDQIDPYNQQCPISWKSRIDNKIHYCKSIEEEILMLSLCITINKMNICIYLKQESQKKNNILQALNQLHQLSVELAQNPTWNFTLTEMNSQIICGWKMILEALLRKQLFYENQKENKDEQKNCQNAYLVFSSFAKVLRHFQKLLLLEYETKSRILQFLVLQSFYFQAIFYYHKGTITSLSQNLEKATCNCYLLTRKTCLQLTKKNKEYGSKIELISINAIMAQKVKKYQNMDISPEILQEVFEEMSNIEKQSLVIEHKSIQQTGITQRVKQFEVKFTKLPKITKKDLKENENKLIKYCSHIVNLTIKEIKNAQSLKQHMMINYYLEKFRINTVDQIPSQIAHVLESVDKLKQYSPSSAGKLLQELQKYDIQIKLSQNSQAPRLKKQFQSLKQQYQQTYISDLEEYLKILLVSGVIVLKDSFKVEEYKNKEKSEELLLKYRALQQKKKSLTTFLKYLEDKEYIRQLKQTIQHSKRKDKSAIALIMMKLESQIVQKFNRLQIQVNEALDVCDSICEEIKKNPQRSLQQEKKFYQNEKKLFQLQQLLIHNKKIVKAGKKLKEEMKSIIEENPESKIGEFLKEKGKENQISRESLFSINLLDTIESISMGRQSDFSNPFSPFLSTKASNRYQSSIMTAAKVVTSYQVRQQELPASKISQEYTDVTSFLQKNGKN